MKDTMNIWALEGHKVKVTEESAKNGSEYNIEEVKRLCKIGDIYTVDHTNVFGSSTDVYLKEFPDTYFNSVCFEDVYEQSEEDNKRHADWKRYR